MLVDKEFNSWCNFRIKIWKRNYRLQQKHWKRAKKQLLTRIWRSRSWWVSCIFHWPVTDQSSAPPRNNHFSVLLFKCLFLAVCLLNSGLWVHDTAAKGIMFLSLSVARGMVSDLVRMMSKDHFINVVFFISLKQTDLEDERNQLQQQILSEKHQYDQKVTGLESQIAALEKAWELDKTTTQHRIVSTKSVELVCCLNVLIQHSWHYNRRYHTLRN